MSDLARACMTKKIRCGLSPSSYQSGSPNVSVKYVVDITPEKHSFHNILPSDCLIPDSGDPKRLNESRRLFLKNVKQTCLFIIWIICSFALILNNEKIQTMHQLSIPGNDPKSYPILENLEQDEIRLIIQGAVLPDYYANLSGAWLHIWITQVTLKDIPVDLTNLKASKIVSAKNVSKVWKIPIVSENLIGVVPEITLNKNLDLNVTKSSNGSLSMLEVQLTTNLNTNFPISMGYNLQPINTEIGIIFAAVILVILYLLIIFEVIHRTLAAMLASTMSVAVLSFFNARPTMSEIISWMDIETLSLLFSMMILVAILSETGIFDYMSVKVFKLTEGKVWLLVNSLCLITALMSCFLDSVTTALLITPVTIKLSEVMKLDPVPILICMIIFSNIGGAITPIGDPPNVIIAQNKAVKESGVNFGVFTLHMGLGVILTFIAIYLLLRFVFFKNEKQFRYKEPKEVRTLRREIQVWKRAAASLGSYTKDEDAVKESLMKRSMRLEGRLRVKTNSCRNLIEDYDNDLKDLEKKYPVRDRVLLIKSGCILLLVVCVFFLHSIPAMRKLGLGWTALLGAILLLLLYDKFEIEAVFARVEWSTLLFFASIFILMEALSKLGLIEWIGSKTESIILTVNEEARLVTAVLLILWVSGIVSAFMDNLPLATMMIKVATNLADNRELNLPLQPLVWALSFGACFGGNGTVFASSSNIVCAGVAEQHGYRFTFLQFMKVGLPVMLTSMLVITGYLVICHVLLQWH